MQKNCQQLKILPARLMQNFVDFEDQNRIPLEV